MTRLPIALGPMIDHCLTTFTIVGFKIPVEWRKCLWETLQELKRSPWLHSGIEQAIVFSMGVMVIWHIEQRAPSWWWLWIWQWSSAWGSLTGSWNSQPGLKHAGPPVACCLLTETESLVRRGGGQLIDTEGAAISCAGGCGGWYELDARAAAGWERELSTLLLREVRKRGLCRDGCKPLSDDGEAEREFGSCRWYPSYTCTLFLGTLWPPQPAQSSIKSISRFRIQVSILKQVVLA